MAEAIPSPNVLQIVTGMKTSTMVMRSNEILPVSGFDIANSNFSDLSGATKISLPVYPRHVKIWIRAVTVGS